MRRFFAILSIFIICFTLFSFPCFAAEYDLGSPSWFGSYASTAFDEDYEFHSLYFYDRDTGEVSASTGIEDTLGFAYFPNGQYLSNANDIYTPYKWGFRWKSFSSLPKPLFTLRSTDYRTSLPVLGFQYTNTFVENTSNLDKLFFPAIIYNDLFIPSSSQFLKVSFEFDSIQTTSIPSALNYLMDAKNFCFLADPTTSGGIVQPYNVQYPSTVTVRKISGRTYNYSYYFNVSGENLSSLFEKLSLIIRFPYFSGGTSINYSGSNLQFLTNASIPSTYEILTVGGYDQELNEITNSLNSVVETIKDGNNVLLNYYSNAKAGDVLVLNAAKNQFDQGKDVVDDYNDANDKIQDIISGAVVPDVNDVINDQIDLNVDTLDPVKDLFQNSFIVSAFLICFAFCLISVLLYGIRG